MPPLTARFVLVAVLALLIAGCTGETDRSAAPSRAASSSASPSQPAASDPRSLTAAELLWIQSVEQLLPTMNKVVTSSPTEMTPAALTTLAADVGRCRSELARIGPASPRLQPAQTLVEQACQAYDQSAACFTAAARVGVPSSTEAFNELEKQVKCGFAATETGSRRLIDAQLKTTDIKNAATGQ